MYFFFFNFKYSFMLPLIIKEYHKRYIQNYNATFQPVFRRDVTITRPGAHLRSQSTFHALMKLL